LLSIGLYKIYIYL